MQNHNCDGRSGRSCNAISAVAFTAALLCGGILSAGDGTRRGHQDWTVVAASGQVEFSGAENAQSSGAWSAAVRGSSIPDYSILRTGKRGRATLARHDSVMVIAPQSEIELPPPGGATMTTSIVQNRGSVLYRVDGQKHPHFEVVTPYLVAGVKGTEFMVSVKDDFASITVEQGAVHVTDPLNGDELEVGPGEFVMRDRERPELELRRDGAGEDSPEFRRESRLMARLDGEVRKDRGDGRSDDGTDRKGEPGPDFSVTRADNARDDVSSDDPSKDELADGLSLGENRSDDRAEDGIDLHIEEDDTTDDRKQRDRSEHDASGSDSSGTGADPRNGNN